MAEVDIDDLSKIAKMQPRMTTPKSQPKKSISAVEEPEVNPSQVLPPIHAKH